MKEVDICKHKLVPKHIVLKDNEKLELLNTYNINLNHLPRILSSDPMIKKLNAKEGDVIEIDRISSTAGNTRYYRVVVQGSFK